MFWVVGGKENELRIMNLECRIHSIRTAHETSGYFLLVRGVFCRVFGVDFGEGLFSCKKELICFRVLGIFTDLLSLRRTGWRSFRGQQYHGVADSSLRRVVSILH